jgi:hypothetical protein
MLTPGSAGIVTLVLDDKVLLTLAVSHTHVKVVECVSLEVERRWTDLAYHANGYVAAVVAADATLYLLTSNGYVDIYERRSGLCKAVIDVAAGSRRHAMGHLRWGELAVNTDETHLTLSSGSSNKVGKTDRGTSSSSAQLAIVDLALYFAQHPTHLRRGTPGATGSGSLPAETDSASGSETAENSQADASSVASSEEGTAAPMVPPLLSPPDSSGSGMTSGLLRRDRRLFAFDMTAGADDNWLSEQRRLAEELRKRDPTSTQPTGAQSRARRV